VAIGSDADISVLEAFTGNREAMLETHSAAALKKMIKFVSVRALKVARTGVVMGEGIDSADVKQNEMVEGLREIKEEAAALDADSGEFGKNTHLVLCADAGRESPEARS